MKYCVKATNTVLTVMDSPNIDRNQGWNHQLTILFHRKIFHATSLSQRKSSILGIWWSTVVGTDLIRRLILRETPIWPSYPPLLNIFIFIIIYIYVLCMLYLYYWYTVFLFNYFSQKYPYLFRIFRVSDWWVSLKK